MALCTQADIEVRLQRDLTADPPTIAGTVDALIAEAQAAVEAEIGRTVESDSRSETFDGGRRTLVLTYWPVTAVASVTEDGTALTADDDYRFYDDGRLIRVSGDRRIFWQTAKAQAIDVTYTGGFLAGTHDAELAHLGSVCAETAARAIRNALAAADLPEGVGAGGIRSIELDGSDRITFQPVDGESAAVGGGLSRFVYLLEDERSELGRYKTEVLV